MSGDGFTVPRAATRQPGGHDTYPFAALLVAGIPLEWLSGAHPTWLGDWGPYEFSWPIYLALTLPVAFYARGLSRASTRLRRPSRTRSALFITGVALVGLALQSRFAFLAQHLFMATRLQHLAIHHLGPFLIALAWPFDHIAAGMPRCARARAVDAVIAVLQRPPVAAVLFVGLICFWLIPPVQFRAMLDPRLYAVMNWTMTLDGLLFWTLILDPRANVARRLATPTCIALVIVVQMPQILLGGLVATTDRDLYPVYRLCGRIVPGIGPLLDQQIGGFIIWYPAAMMSVIAVFILLGRLRREEERTRQAAQSA